VHIDGRNIQPAAGGGGRQEHLNERRAKAIDELFLPSDNGFENVLKPQMRPICQELILAESAVFAGESFLIDLDSMNEMVLLINF
jgi:hypothetical protein